MLHAVIMAGGSGTRFWPESRNAKPKQMLPLAGSSTMIQATLDRLDGCIDPKNVLVVTNQSLVEAICDQLPSLPKENVVGEPAKRDTAPCVALAAEMVQHRDSSGLMLVMPSDHVIKDRDAFAAAVRVGERLIEADPTRIVTFGIKPTYPAESFGYIQRAAAIEDVDGKGDQAAAFEVERFREKPDRETAESYLATGNFYWNSGIFMWRCDTILNAIEANAPQIAQSMRTVGQAIGTSHFPDVLKEQFESVQGTSIDYAVMESYPNVAVVEAPFDWDDVGSWQAISRLHPDDKDGNTVVGNHLGIDTRGCIVRTHGDHIVVTIDVDDLIVVQTPDATLVAPKHAEERVREAVQALSRSDLQQHL